MIESWVTGDAAVVASLKAKGPQIVAAVRASIQKSALRVQRLAREKVNGEVLNVRTGTLRRSINSAMDGDDTNIVGVVSTNVKYARRLEYGFHGTETVREHMRMMTVAFGKQVKNPHKILVHSFSRTANTAEHSFLRSSLHDLQDQIKDDLERAVWRALDNGA